MSMKRICFLNHFSCLRRASACARNVEGDIADKQWRIASSVCVQRFPRLTRTQTPLEKRYHKLQVSLRMKRSQLSDFELEENEYVEKKVAREKKALEEDLDASEVAMMEKEAVFEELQESRDTELQSFVPQQRNDSHNNMQSVNRKLDEMLYLLVKKPREKFSWQFPQGGIDDGESLIEAGVRELHEECGTELKVVFLSNSPFAYHCYNHEIILNNLIGTKVFFFKAQYVSGSIRLNLNELEQFVWVTKDEMKNYVSSDYYNAIAPTLIS